MHPVVAIALKDLRQRLRDRSAWVLGIIAPMAVAGLISVAFGGAQTFHTSVAVVDNDHGAIAAGFSQFLRSPDLHGLLTVKPASGSVDATVAAQVARALAQSFTAHLEGVQLSVRTAVAAGAPASAISALAAQASTGQLPVQAQPQASGTKTLTA